MIEHSDFRFYHIPKTGGSTIGRFLERHLLGCTRRYPTHAPPIDVPVDRLSFTIIRKPDDWICSLFRNRIRDEFGKADPHKREQPEDAWARKEFNGFVRALLESPRGRAWCSQVYSWYLIEPRLIVLPTEKLDSVFPLFSRENNISINQDQWSGFARENTSTGEKPKWDKEVHQQWLERNWWAMKQWEQARNRYS